MMGCSGCNDTGGASYKGHYVNFVKRGLREVPLSDISSTSLIAIDNTLLVLQRRIYDGTLAAGPFPSQMYVVQMSQQYLRHEAFPKQHVKPSL